MANLPSVLTDALASGEVHRADDTSVPLHGAVLLDDARRLYDLVKILRPDASVEIGLAQGISALAIAQALEDNAHGVHHVVDPYQSAAWDDIGLTNLRRAGLDGRVRFYEQFVEEVVPTLPPVGFAFVDGSHRFDEAMVDFVLIDKRLEVGGIIGFHDLWMNALQKLLRYILANRAYRVYEDVPRRSSPKANRARASKLAARVPNAERIFRPEVLHLSDDLGLPRTSLVFIEKLADDDRDPDFHRDF
jgi:predicted O-methyltransferase YrrM